MTSKTTTTVEVWEQHYTDGHWQTIEGAAWPMEWREGETFREACIRHGGEFPSDAVFRLVARDQDGNEIAAEEFEPGDI